MYIYIYIYKDVMEKLVLSYIMKWQHTWILQLKSNLKAMRGVNQRATHNDTVLLVGFKADSSDITDIYAAQRAEEAGLAVLMTC